MKPNYTIAAVVAGAAATVTAGAAYAGVITGALSQLGSGLLIASVTGIVTFIAGKAMGVVSAKATAARAKDDAEKSLADKGIIWLESQLTQARIDRLTQFSVEFAKAHLDKLDPLRAPIDQADALVTGYLEAFERRLPELSREMRLDRQSATERLAGAITTVINEKAKDTDALAAALRKIPGVGNVVSSR